MSKDLLDKAIKIKGKNYVLVSDRVIYFNEEYPNGSIETSYELIENMFIAKTTVTPDVKEPSRRFTGHSQAIIGDGMVNKTAALENAETSATGRALAMMGIGVIESIASVDEINKAVGSDGLGFTPMNKLINVAQATNLLEKSKEYSGLTSKEAVTEWFYEKCGMQITQVKSMEYDNVLRYLLEERDV